MKQRITVEQLNELSDEQKGKLREWWKPEAGDFFVWYDEYLKHEELAQWVTDEYELGFYSTGECEYPKNECLPLLNIGQIIELLESKTDTWDMTMRNDGEYKEYELEWHGDEFSYSEKRELCDALWQAVKAVL